MLHSHHTSIHPHMYWPLSFLLFVVCTNIALWRRISFGTKIRKERIHWIILTFIRINDNWERSSKTINFRSINIAMTLPNGRSRSAILYSDHWPPQRFTKPICDFTFYDGPIAKTMSPFGGFGGRGMGGKWGPYCERCLILVSRFSKDR